MPFSYTPLIEGGWKESTETSASGINRIWCQDLLMHSLILYRSLGEYLTLEVKYK